MSVRRSQALGRTSCSSGHAKPGRKSMRPRPRIVVSPGRSPAAYSASSCTAASTWSTMPRSGPVVVAISRISTGNRSSIPGGTEPEVSMMTAMASIPSRHVGGYSHRLAAWRRSSSRCVASGVARFADRRSGLRKPSRYLAPDARTGQSSEPACDRAASRSSKAPRPAPRPFRQRCVASRGPARRGARSPFRSTASAGRDGPAGSPAWRPGAPGGTPSTAGGRTGDIRAANRDWRDHPRVSTHLEIMASIP